MRKLRWNWPAWAGFLLSILAFVSYFTVLDQHKAIDCCEAFQGIHRNSISR